MKALQITFFILANIIFLTQCGRDVHQLIWGTEASVLDQFDTKKMEVRSEKNMDTLLDEYRKVAEETRVLEQGKHGWNELQEARKGHDDLYEKKQALMSEITEREAKRRELRDLWLFTGYGSALIVLGVMGYRLHARWAGVSMIITGFIVFEYWASPTFYRGATAEYHAVLVSKTVLTFVALGALYAVWHLIRVRSADAKS